MAKTAVTLVGWFIFILGVAIPIPLLFALSGPWSPLDILVRFGLAFALIWGGWKLSHRRKYAEGGIV